MAEMARAARRRWRDVPEFKDMQHLDFREELHPIEAVYFRTKPSAAL